MIKITTNTPQEFLNERTIEAWRLPLHRTHGLSKNYDRNPVVELPEPLTLDGSLIEALMNRTSTIKQGGNLKLMQVSQLLHWSLGKKNITDKDKRMYPSGGSSYPIEAYITVNEVDGLSAGVYHYSPNQHNLSELPWVKIQDILNAMKLDDIERQDPSLIIVLSAIENRQHFKYGIFSTKLALLEAGHVGQNICLVSTLLKVSVLPMGLPKSASIIGSCLRLEAGNESVIYGFSISP